MAEDNSSFMSGLGNFQTVDTSEEMENFLNGDEKPIIKKEEKKPEEIKKEHNKVEQPEEDPTDIEAELDEFLDGDGEEIPVKKSIKKEPTKEEDKEESEDKESQTFSILSKELLDKGLFTLDEDEEELIIATEAEFMDRFDYEARKLAGKALDGLFSSKGEKAKNAVQAIIIDGVDPEEYFTRFIEIENLETYNLDDEGSQKDILKKYYQKLGKKDDVIQTKIQRLENIGELAEEARDAHSFLLEAKRKEFETLKATQAQEAQRKQQEKVIYQNSVNQILSDKFREKQFDGIPLDKKTLDSVSAYLLKENNQTSSGHRFSNFEKDLMDLNKPENVQKKVKVALLLQLMETDPYLTKIQKKKDSEKVNSLYNKLASSTKRTTESRAFSDL